MKVGVFLAGFLMCSNAHAQQVQQKTVPMQFAVVRGSGDACEPRCPEWISAQGSITADSPSGLKRVLTQLKGRKLPIIIQSGGGRVEAGIAMGRMIREAGLVTAVGSSPLPEPCKPRDRACALERKSNPLRGMFNLRRSHCSSACTFMLAGGVRRIVHNEALLGVHRLTRTSTNRQFHRRFYVERRMVGGRMVEVKRRLISERLVSEKTVTFDMGAEAADSIKVGRHLQSMGVAPEFYALTLATPAKSIRYLTPDEKRSNLIATDTSDHVTALGFDKANPYFNKPARLGAYFGFMPMGSYDGAAATMEFSADISKLPNVTLRILRGTEALNSSHVRLFAMSPPRFAAIAETAAEAPSGPLVFNMQNEAFCKLTPYTVLTISIHRKDAVPHASPVWIRSGTGRELLPLSGLQGAICSDNHWER
jgi:hypothetical protein